MTPTPKIIGCDSDDTPTVTPPSGGGSGTTPTRNTTAETQGREGLEVTDNGTMIRNTGGVALNVRFAYDEPKHYRLNVNTAMPSDPGSAGSAPARVACGVPATGRANGQCFNNDRSEIQSAPTPYEASGNGDNGNGAGGGGDGNGNLPLEKFSVDSSLRASDCVRFAPETSGREEVDRGYVLTNRCAREIEVEAACSTVSLEAVSPQSQGDTRQTLYRWAFNYVGGFVFRGGGTILGPRETKTTLGPRVMWCETNNGGNPIFIACYNDRAPDPGYDRVLGIKPVFLSPVASNPPTYTCNVHQGRSQDGGGDSVK